MTTKKPTIKQQRFIDVYDGDILKAAELSGLSHGYCKQLMSLPKHSHVVLAIKERELTSANPKIKTREERQAWWSGMMDTAERDSDKLKASELLGKSQADFTDIQRHQGDPDKPLKWTIELVEAPKRE